MNKQHKCLKFTSESENDNSFWFQHIKLTSHNQQSETSVYRKPIFSAVFTHYQNLYGWNISEVTNWIYLYMSWKTKKILLDIYLGIYNTSDKLIILWTLIRQTNRFLRKNKELLDKYILALQIFKISVISTHLRYLLLYKIVKCTNSGWSKQLEVLKRSNLALFK